MIFTLYFEKCFFYENLLKNIRSCFEFICYTLREILTFSYLIFIVRDLI